MSISKTQQITDFSPSSVPVLNNIIDHVMQDALTFKYTSTVPTASTVMANELVIYDNAAGTKRIYLKTGLGNLGYVALT